RTAAMARFADVGFPKPRDEEWRHTNVSPIVRTPFGAAPEADAAEVGPADIAPHRLGGGALEAVFRNGRFGPAPSSLQELPSGVEVLSLKDALRREPAALEPHLARVADPGATPFAALNTAFLEDGVFVRLAAGTVVAAPIHLLFFSTNAGAPTVSYP